MKRPDCPADSDKLRVGFFTASFPYPPGEQFIESEIEHWSEIQWAEMILCPSTVSGQRKPIPHDIMVFEPPRNMLCGIWWNGIRALGSAVFWRELHYLREQKSLSLTTFLSALHETAGTLKCKSQIAALVSKHGTLELAYCYWNSRQAYAACLVKREGKIRKVITRAHGFDLYEIRRHGNYMPLKRQFREDMDVIFAISAEGCAYLRNAYGFSNSCVKISRLGVKIPPACASQSDGSVVRVVSVSSCIPVKRIDRIIDAVSTYASAYPEVRVEWIHIGDGLLRANLEQLARDKLNSLSNAAFEFVGAVSNQEVLNFYSRENVDLLINLSESEGVPVSIMEAMSYGIPSVALDVGGISELVNNECGALLPENYSERDIHDAINRLSGALREDYKYAARKQIENRYCARTNYRDFVATVERIVGDGVDAYHSGQGIE